eukprot:1157707-Pelagomonas_calceolata.AAC.14
MLPPDHSLRYASKTITAALRAVHVVHAGHHLNAGKALTPGCVICINSKPGGLTLAHDTKLPRPPSTHG